MAFRYSINLIRDEVSRSRAQKAFLRVLMVSLFIFAIMLANTLVLFVWVNNRISTQQRETLYIVKSMVNRGVRVKDVKELEKKSDEVTLLLDALAKVASRTISWSSVMADLGEATKGSNVRLRRVDSDKVDGRDVIHVQGFSMEPNPAAIVDAYIERIRARERFADAHLASLERDEKSGESVFVITVPLNIVEVESPTEARKKAAEEAKKKSEEGGGE